MRKPEVFTRKKVHDYYWHEDINCATVTLKILSERCRIPLNSQVLDAAVGMHGAGEYGAQCGLVEGALMFLGIFGKAQGLKDVRIAEICKDFAKQFENRFGSLLCAVLRPQGFRPENPPHLCEHLTCEALAFDMQFIYSLSA